MDQKTKDRLKKIPKTKCAECKSKKNSCNPMARCFECKGNFCYEHIWGGQFKESMRESDALRDICDLCRKEHGYGNL